MTGLIEETVKLGDDFLKAMAEAAPRRPIGPTQKVIKAIQRSRMMLGQADRRLAAIERRLQAYLRSLTRKPPSRRKARRR